MGAGAGLVITFGTGACATIRSGFGAGGGIAGFEMRLVGGSTLAARLVGPAGWIGTLFVRSGTVATFVVARIGGALVRGVVTRFVFTTTGLGCSSASRRRAVSWIASRLGETGFSARYASYFCSAPGRLF